MRSDLTTEDWAALKALWSEFEQAGPDTRERFLERDSLPPKLRQWLQALATVDEDDLQFFDGGAMSLLGIGTSDDTGGKNARETATLVGRRLGPYMVRRLVARGGMGAVYEADRIDDEYRQRVAIKTVWRGVDSDVMLKRFRSERQILAGLQHPNIAQLLDGGSTGEGTPWLALEFVDGTPIDEWCDARRLGIAERLDLFRQVCAAVQHAHRCLVIHRDLKPSNVMVTGDGVVKLLDFGVAKLVQIADHDGTLTGAGLSPFTAGWAAPEQLSGEFVSTQSDIYALGAMLTHLLAGAPPRDLRTTREFDVSMQARKLAEIPSRLPSEVASVASHDISSARGFASAGKLAKALGGELDAIAGKATHTEPGRRYATVEALSEDVHRYLRRERVLARPDSSAYRLRAFLRRRRALSAAIGISTVAVVTATVVSMREARIARDEARRAERATAFLSGLVTGANATSYDPLVRLAPNGTLSQLIDSAIVRIPREFADDIRMRAQLYTAIGANLVTQRRSDRALVVLDSARYLAALGYGKHSREYARASLEYGAQRLEIDGLAASQEPLGDVEAVVRANPDDHELSARLTLLRAAQLLITGHIAAADSLAASVVDAERNGPRGLLSLRAESMRMYASSWIRRDPRDYLVRARAVQALADSLGLMGTNEQNSALLAEFEALLVLGRTEEAQQLLQRLRAQASPMDSSALSRAIYARQRAFLAEVAGDTTSRRIAVEELRRALGEVEVLSASDRLQFTGTIVNDALSRGDTGAAAATARVTSYMLRNTGSPILLGFAAWYAGQAELAARQPLAALAAAEEGERWVQRAPDTHSLLPLLRRVQVGALRELGRTSEADSVQALLPKPRSIPPCTPGGDWKGCADLPTAQR